MYLGYSLSLAYGLIKGYPKEIATVSLALSQSVSVRNVCHAHRYYPDNTYQAESSEDHRRGAEGYRNEADQR